MNDSFHADLYAATRLCRIEITELEEKRPGRFHDLLRWRVRRLIHAAFITRQSDHTGNPWAAGCHLRSPHDLVRIAAVRRSPYIRDVEWTPNPSGTQIRFKEPVHQIFVTGKILQPQDRISVRLQLSLDLVADSGVHVIRASEHE